MKKATFGIVVFPGTNCDRDVFYVCKEALGQNARYIFHKEKSLRGIDCVVLPGGFSYGDYLRCGAIARFSPVMESVVRFAERGGLVIGICNGFQILTEAGLLPGAFLHNSSLQFRCLHGDELCVRVENTRTPFTNRCVKRQVLRIPIAHGEGSYFCDSKTLKELRQKNQIVLRYCSTKGKTGKESNPNGSVFDIAGIINESGNVLGMMPHPERCSEEILGGRDGLFIWNSILKFLDMSPKRRTTV